MNKIAAKIFTHGWIILICTIAFVLRIKGLGFQSLWLDELHTMNEADPSISWGELFDYLRSSDQHPPLFFIIERLAFTIFGHTAYVARLIPALAGTASVWAMYKLGKESFSKSLGIICAILTTVNYYDLSYSQEARPYIFSFLFAALSFTYFIRLIKAPSVRTAVVYSIFTVLMLYSHYYSLFVVVAQLVAGLIFIFQEKGSARKDLFNKFLLSAAIVIVCYLPLISFLRSVGRINSFWIKDISPAFMQDYFYEFFGNAEIVKPLLLFLLFIYVVRVSLNAGNTSLKSVKEDPVSFSFIIILFWVFIVFIIPYVRSLLVVPMLHPRYAIIVLPAIILALGYGIDFFKTPLLKYSVTGLFIILSLINLFLVKKYYAAVTKTQFREMTAYVVRENSENFPIINERTAWHQGYYLHYFSSQAMLVTGKKEVQVESILQSAKKGEMVEGFWIVGAHGDPLPGDSTNKALDSVYILLKQMNFYDAWARLYISKSYKDSSYSLIGYKDFKTGEGTLLEDEKQIGVWSGSIHSNPLLLKKGKYRITVTAMGTKAGNEYPHVNIYCNGKKLGSYYATGNMEEKEFQFENNTDTNVAFTIEMDNDLFLPSSKEDRNLFVKGIIIHQQKE